MSNNNPADRLGISRYDASRLDVVALMPRYHEEHLAFPSFASGFIVVTVRRRRRLEQNCA
jgi:hypothetical protein